MRRLLAKVRFNFIWYKWLVWDCPGYYDAVIDGQYSPTRRFRQMAEWRTKEPKWNEDN